MKCFPNTNRPSSGARPIRVEWVPANQVLMPLAMEQNEDITTGNFRCRATGACQSYNMIHTKQEAIFEYSVGDKNTAKDGTSCHQGADFT
jgi:hypothetical protein